MIETVTITHHQAKPEYKWEIVLPEGPTILLPDHNLPAALQLLGQAGDNTAPGQMQEQMAQLPNGGSRSLNVELRKHDVEALVALGVKTV